MDLPQSLTPDSELEPRVQETTERSDRQRTELQAADSLLGESSPEAERERLGNGAATSDQECNRLIGEASNGVLECGRRRSVEPLNVVDGDDHRPLCGERAQEPGERREDCAWVGWTLFGFLEQERDVQRTLLGRRKGGQHVFDDVAEQICQSCERELRLGAHRRVRQHES
ncbi:MAG TPA: hypothetical protein VML35_02545 [Gaiellaceae bacterium]|nr:hypothetical protein [Gaiellaceae bacterium]